MWRHRMAAPCAPQGEHDPPTVARAPRAAPTGPRAHLAADGDDGANALALGHLPRRQANALRRLLPARSPLGQRVDEACKTPRVEKSELRERVIEAAANALGRLRRLRCDTERARGREHETLGARGAVATPAALASTARAPHARGQCAAGPGHDEA